MDASALHRLLDEVAPAVLGAGSDADLAAAEAHAEAGCSRCARALYNAREAAVELAEAEVMAAPRLQGSLKDRVLATARRAGLGARPASMTAPPRLFDASGEQARKHLGTAEDAARIAEVDALHAAIPHEDDACGRMLAQIERMIAFPLLFVSVVRGPRVGYRVQRGLDVAFAEMRDRRRETTFCTHTISGEAPLVVADTAADPFFRGSNMVRRMGVRAYAGVPLVTSRGLAVGTVCAMDFRPRVMSDAVVRALELFTEPILAEVERARRAPADRMARTQRGAPSHRAPWMRALIEVELSLARAAGRPSALIVARGAEAEALVDLAREPEPAGLLAEGVAAILLPGAGARVAVDRREELVTALAPRADLALRAVPADTGAPAAAWIEAAIAGGA